MIFGAFSHSLPGSVSYLHYANNNEEIPGASVVPVRAAGFNGGYCLHSRLPYRSDDVFYSSNYHIIVLLSGCIYNWHELNGKKAGSKKVPDAQKIAELFIEEGPDFVARLNGDFGICILLPDSKQIYLFRDHVGVRPLAWSLSRDMLFFSSDINMLSTQLCSGEPFNQNLLMGHFKYVDLRNTPCSKVKKLLPGHWLRFDEQGIEIREYWNPAMFLPDRTMTYDKMISDLGKLLEDAVKIRHDGRFIAGAHVSGGLDSGVVAALARKACTSQPQFCGFSLSPISFEADKVRYDERELVRKLCRMAGIRPVFSDMTLSDFKGYIASYASNQGYFVEDKVLDQARGLGVNLLFSGWGGDEFISTGSRSIEADLFWGMQLGTFFRRNPVRRHHRLLNVIIKAVLLPSLGIIDRDLSRTMKMEARYLLKEFKRSNTEALKNFFMHSSRRSHHIGMLRHYHLQERCEIWSVNGWKRGIEYRYPLLDRRIIEYMLTIPSILLCGKPEPRPLLRTLGKGLIPEEILHNKSKVDPVYREFIGYMFAEAGREMAGETILWRSNPDLAFVDFDTLERDLSRHNDNPAGIDVRKLFRTVVIIKALHEYTLWYHQQQLYRDKL